MSSSASKPGRGGRGKRGASADAVARSHSAASLAALASNPFEARENKKLRVNVLGRRVHGASRNVALARSKAMERRGHTLRKELDAEGRANTFQDKRFGEYDDSMDAETRMLVRLQRERKRQLASAGGRKRKFNLEEDAADTAADGLTHFGKSLSEMGAFDEGPEPRGDDDVDATMDAAVTAAHFGGGSSMPDWRGKRPVPAWMASEGPAAKTYTEIMEEVIAKSKAAKAERAQEKASQDFKLEWLDQRFDSVAKLLHKGEAQRAAAAAAATVTAGNSTAAADAFLAAFHAEEAANAGDDESHVMASSTAMKAFAPLPPSARATARGAAGGDDFDALLHTLAKQSRAAAAADRTKSAEEVAAEEHARLTELESLRLARMRGDAAPAAATGAPARVHEGGDDLGPVIQSMLTHRQRKRARAGASILDYADTSKASSKAAKEESDDESEDDDDDDEDDDGGDDDGNDDDGDDNDEEAASDDNDAAGMDEDDRGSDVMDVDIAAPAEGRSTRAAQRADATGTAYVIPAVAAEMPFTPACPRTLDEWHSMLRQYVLPLVTVAPTTEGDVPVAGKKRSRAAAAAPAVVTDTAAAQSALEELLRRVVACHSIKVKASHREALGQLYRILLDDVRALGDSLSAAQCTATVGWRIRALHRTLFQLAQDAPVQALASAAWRDMVDSIRARVTAALQDAHTAVHAAATATDAALRAHPGWFTGGEVLLVTMACTLFPASDFRHPILLPLQLLLCQCMTQVPIANESDAAAACVHAALVMDMIAPGRRYAPEVIGSISSCLRSLSATIAPTGSLASIPVQETDPNWATFAKSLSSTDVATMLRTTASSQMHIPVCILPSPAEASVDDTVRLLQPSSGGPTRSDVMHALLHSVTALAARACEYMAPVPPTAAPLSNAIVSMLEAACAPTGNAARSHAPSSSQTGPPLCLLTHMPQAPFPCAPEVIDVVINPLTILLAALPEDVHHLRPLRKAMQSCLTSSIARRNGIVTWRPPMRVFELSGAPRAVRQMAPLVEDINHRKRDIPGSKPSEESEMAEGARLREELRAMNRVKKREMRGAVRELRLDRAYVVHEADKVTAARDVQRTAKFKEVMTSLQVQAADAKQQVRKATYKGAVGTTAAAAPLAGLAKAISGPAAAGERLRNATRGTKKDRVARKTRSREVGSGGGKGGRK